jgi:DNA mismatch repair protein MSH6
MVKTEDGVETTPARPPPSLKKQSSSTGSAKNQRSILGFFSKTPSNGTQAVPNGSQKTNGLSAASNGNPKLPSSTSKKPTFSKVKSHNITPVPSSDPAGFPSSQENVANGAEDEVDNGLLSPVTPAKLKIKQDVNDNNLAVFSSPSRRVSH